MPQPTAGDAHVDVLLTDFSVAFSQLQQTYIADLVFGIVPVTQQSNKYRYYPRRQWFRTAAEKRAPGTPTPGSGWVYSTDSYFCEMWGVHKDISDPERANEDPGISLERDATDFVTNQLLLKRDLEWKNAFWKTGVWSTDLTGVASAPTGSQFLRWDQAASTPMQDILTRAIQMQRTTGVRPNTLVIGPEVEVALLNHPQILDRIKYSQEGVITYDLLARYFNVDRILVANAVQDTSLEAQNENPDATTSMSFVFGKQALLTYSNPNPGLRRVSAGYTFVWSGLYGAGAHGGRIKQFRMEEIASDRVEIEAAWSQKVTAPDLGVFWDSVVA